MVRSASAALATARLMYTDPILAQVRGDRGSERAANGCRGGTSTTAAAAATSELPPASLPPSCVTTAAKEVGCSNLVDTDAHVPGTCVGNVFRCGYVDSNGDKQGWHGHCLAASAVCDGVANDCGDNTDETGCPKSCTQVCSGDAFPRTVFDNGVCRPSKPRNPPHVDTIGDGRKRVWYIFIDNYICISPYRKN